MTIHARKKIIEEMESKLAEANVALNRIVYLERELNIY